MFSLKQDMHIMLPPSKSHQEGYRPSRKGGAGKTVQAREGGGQL